VLATIGNAIPNDVVYSVSTADASMTAMAPLDTLLLAFDVISAALRNDAVVYGNNTSNDTLYEIDYQLVCVGQLTLGTVTAAPNAHAIDSLCGVTFGANAQMYGIDPATDTLVEIDEETGSPGTTFPLTLAGEPLDVGSCGMAWDCMNERLIVANGLDGNVYEIDDATGNATLLADTGLTSNPTGVEHDPATGNVWLASDDTLSEVLLDGSNTVNTVGVFSDGLGTPSVSNLAWLPSCDP
jgi:DNA-binding beta-propeller fold protein YncE